jgi:hypothetical protein
MNGDKYEVISTIWLNEIIWPVGTILIKDDWRCYDKDGRWLNYNYITKHIQKVETKTNN